MDISCDIIRDLLPLYAEDLASEDSKKIVDDHLFVCESCAKQLSIMKRVVQLPLEVDIGALKRVGNTIRRRRIMAVLTVVFFMITIIAGAVLLMDARIYLTAEQAVHSVELQEDGSVFIRFTNYVIGTRSSQHSDTNNVGILAWSNLRKMLFEPKEPTSYEELRRRYEALDPAFQTQLTEEDYRHMGGFSQAGAEKCNVWYCSGWTGMPETILWEGYDQVTVEPLIEVNYYLIYYYVSLLLLAALFILAGRYLKNRRYKECCIRVAMLSCCICLSSLIVTAGQFMVDFKEVLVDSSAVALPMIFTVLFGRQLYLLNKQDKAG